MFRWQRFHLVFAIYGLLVSISAFITAYALFLIPSDPRNSIFLGLSLQRLIMLGSVSLAGILLAVFAVKAYRDKSWSERVWLSLFGREAFAKGIRWGAAAGLISGLIVSCHAFVSFWGFSRLLYSYLSSYCLVNICQFADLCDCVDRKVWISLVTFFKYTSRPKENPDHCVNFHNDLCLDLDFYCKDRHGIMG